MTRIYRFLLWARIHPNHITFSRFLLVFLGACLYRFGYLGGGFFCIVLGWFTDLIDGHFARSMGLVSEDGKLLDRLSDKVCFIFLVVAYWWMKKSDIVVLFFSFSLVLLETLGVLLVLYQREFEYKAKKRWAAVKIGKEKLVFQAIFSATLYFPFTFWLLKPVILVGSGSFALVWTVFSLKYHGDCIDRRRFGKFLIVSLITVSAVLLGVWALQKAVASPSLSEEAILLIFIAASLDRIDGWLARSLNVSSEKFGLILDDVADFWNFGIVSGFILGKVSYYYLPEELGFYFVFSFWSVVIFLRLVDFTFQKRKNSKETNDFRGLPAPPAALLALSACLVFSQPFLIFSWIMFSAFLASLWVWDIRFPKHIPYEKFWAFLSMVVLIGVIIKAWPIFYLGLYTIGFVLFLTWRALK